MKVLFLGIGTTPPSWYRCGLPAIQNDWDWAGVAGDPYDYVMLGGNMNERPTFDDYDVIVAQQPYGTKWEQFILEQQAKGQKILFECDDFVLGVGRVKGHKFAAAYGKERRKNFKRIMPMCDGMILSTDYLSEALAKYNDNRYVCKNSIDTWRYEVKFPERDYLVIGWSGGTGHDSAMREWLQAVNEIMYSHPNVAFASMGIEYADLYQYNYPGRNLFIPWTTLENYPYALTNFDIVIAPGHESKYHLSKSDLRWLEASAVGLPTVADPRVYGDVEPDITGLVAQSKEEIFDQLYELVNDENFRKEIGDNARQYVQGNRDISQGADQWQKVISQL